MRTFIKLVLGVAIVATWASCDKKEKGEELSPNQPTDKPIMANIPVASTELLSYYFTLIINEKSSLRILYFTKVGNQVQATMDNVHGRRIHPVDLKNNVLTFDADGDGKKVYKFKLTRNFINAPIIISSFEYKNQDLDTVSLKYAHIEKVSAVKEFRNKVFNFNIVHPDYSETRLLFFSNNQFCIAAPPAVITIFAPFYIVSIGAWKGKSASGEDCIGVSTTSKNYGTGMWFQASGSPRTFFAREYASYP